MRFLLFALVAAVAVALALISYGFGISRSFELSTVDTRFEIRGTDPLREDLAVVGIDTRTTDAIGERLPYTHDHHARVVEALVEDGAKVIAFDIQFSERSDTDEQSLAFADAIHEAENVVVATTETDRLGNGNAFEYLVDDDEVFEASKRPDGPRQGLNKWLRDEYHLEIGHAHLPNDPGAVLRRVEYETDRLKTFSVVAAERVRGRTIDPDALGGDSAWIDYAGPPGTIPHYSYSDVRSRRTKPGTFRDRIVVIGNTAPSLQDTHQTATSGDELMAGPEVQANAIATALAG
jgi:CHASE2 domain-containing sensor protein